MERLRDALASRARAEAVLVEITDAVVTDEPLVRVTPDADGGDVFDEVDSANAANRWNERARIVLTGRELETRGSVCVVAEVRLWVRVAATPAFAGLWEECVRKLRLDRDDVCVEEESLPKLFGCFLDVVGKTWRTYPFRKIWVASVRAMRAVTKFFQDSGVEVTDHKTTPLSKVLCGRHIVVSDFVAIDPARIDDIPDADDQVSHCALEIHASWEAVSDASSACGDRSTGRVVCAIDGEMSSWTNAFPRVYNGDSTFCISAAVWDSADSTRSIRYYAYYTSCARGVATAADAEAGLRAAALEARGIRAVFCETVADMFDRFRHDLVSEIQPDIVTGWNIYGFDLDFMTDNYRVVTNSTIDERFSERMELQMAQAVDASLAPPPLLTWFATLPSAQRSELLRAASFEIGSRFVHNFVPRAEVEVYGYHVRQLRDICAKHGAGRLPDCPPTPSHILRRVFRGDVDQMDRACRARIADWTDGHSYLLRLAERPRPNAMGMDWSALRADAAGIYEKRMQSAAQGDNVFTMLGSRVSQCGTRARTSLVGRTQLDLMQWIKYDKKPASNRLDDVAEEFIADKTRHKITFDKDLLFRIARSGTRKEELDVVEYCVQDSAVCVWLMQQLSYVPTLVEMSRVCRTPMHLVVNGGQQIKVYNIIAYTVRDASGAEGGVGLVAQDPADEPLPPRGFAINDGKSGWPSGDHREFDCDNDGNDTSAAKIQTRLAAGGRLRLESRKRARAAAAEDTEDDGARRAPDYQGATVLPPQPGFYKDNFVVVLDFMSLYPSIMQAHNLCYTTLVSDPAELSRLSRLPHAVTVSIATTTDRELEALEASGKLVLVQYPITHIDGRTGETFVRVYTFCQSLRGVLARILTHVLAARKAAKRAKKEAVDPVQRDNLEGRQLALKVSANSTYGFTGCSPETGRLSCKPIAASVTTVGRAMIELTKRLVEARFPGAVVVYGDTDSVMVRLPSDVTDLRVAESVAERMAALVDAELHRKKKLEFEKTFKHMLLFPQKKTYAALSFEPGEDRGKVYIKGLDPVRRDRSLLQRDIVERMISIVVEQGDEDLATRELCAFLGKLGERRVPMRMFVMSKSIRRHYANPETQPQVHARRKLIAAGAEEVPPIGARIAFVFEGKRFKRAQTIAAAAVHPAHTSLERVNVSYYIQKLENPLLKVLQFTRIPVTKLVQESARFAEATGGSQTRLRFGRVKPLHEILLERAHCAAPSTQRRSATQASIANFFRAEQ